MSGSTVATTGYGTLVQDQLLGTVGSRPGLKRGGEAGQRGRYTHTHILYILGLVLCMQVPKLLQKKQKFQGSVNKINTDIYADAHITLLHIHTKVSKPAFPHFSRHTWKPLVHYPVDY